MPESSSGLIGIAEKLLAATAVMGAAIYVLFNALYVEFLDDFGLRPEDVGIDRVAVLGRAAWVALVVIVGGTLVASLWVHLANRRDPNDPESDESSESSESRHRAALVRRTAPAISLLAVALLLVGYWALRERVESAAEDARRGERVGGIGFFLEIVDIRALPARLAWVGDAPRPPDISTEETYLYLGRGDDVVALLTCQGSTVMLRPDDVVVTVLERDGDDIDTGRPAPVWSDDCGDAGRSLS